MANPSGFSPKQSKVNIAEAHLFMQSKRYYDALKLLHQVINELEPHNVEAHLMAGEIFSDLQNGEQLNKVIDHLFTFQEPTPDSLLLKARAEFFLGQFDDCEETIDQIENIKRDFLEAAVLKGDLYIRINNANEAVSIFRGIFPRKPEPEIRLKLAMAYYQAGKYSEALTLSWRLVQSGYKNPRATNLYKVAYQKKLEKWREDNKVNFFKKPWKWIKSFFHDPDVERGLRIESEHETELGEMELQRQENEKETLLDHMTGCFNQKAAHTRIPGIYVQRKKDTFVCFFDIDFFKAFNDCYSHRVGDQVIQTVATAGQEFFGKEYLYRVGGDEFIWVMDSTEEEALKRAEEFRVDIERNTLRAVNEILIEKKVNIPKKSEFFQIQFPVTISQGVAKWGEDGSTFDQVKSAADNGLYVIKEIGKNAVAYKSLVKSKGEKPLNYTKPLIAILNELTAGKGAADWWEYTQRISAKEREVIYKKGQILLREREASPAVMRHDLKVED